MLLIRSVKIASTSEAEQLPMGRLKTGYVRISTCGNTGDIYIADSETTALAGNNRFTIGEGKLTPLRLPVGFELSDLWVAAATSNDVLGLIAELA